MTGRYRADGPEAEFERGSRGRVLLNRLCIKSVREMQRKESDALLIDEIDRLVDYILEHQPLCIVPSPKR